MLENGERPKLLLLLISAVTELFVLNIEPRFLKMSISSWVSPSSGTVVATQEHNDVSINEVDRLITTCIQSKMLLKRAGKCAHPCQTSDQMSKESESPLAALTT